ncbi:MAG: hypothetical protein M1837_007118 [Sclerophora amabilis]|nr:MAG: hypothetical protein M1837_007118 [Sclerophora amabilis]
MRAPRILLWILFTTLTSSQTPQQPTQILDFSAGALPACANACVPLQSAQGACIPPAVPVTDTATYKSCFCKSAFLQTLYTSPSGICDTACPADGLAQMREWFIRQCEQKPTVAATTVTSTSTSTSSTPTQPTADSAATEDASTESAQRKKPPPRSWWSTHWQWVLMLIIIILAIIVGSVGGVAFKRRHKRKAAAAASAAMATPVAWGPHQHQHHSAGYNYNAQQSTG